MLKRRSFIHYSPLRFMAMCLIPLCLNVPLSLAADIENGEKLFGQCSVCHNNASQAPAKIGPNLWGIINRPVAKQADFDTRYSSALKKIEGVWSTERIAAFITNPQAFAPGTFMGFAGFQSVKDRADLIAFLNTHSDSPLNLAQDATQNNIATIEPKTQHDTPANIGKLFRANGAQKVFTYCSACHSERIVTQQGLSKADWGELLEWMIDEQGMDEITEPDYSTVINYLSTHYGIDRPNFPNKDK